MEIVNDLNKITVNYDEDDVRWVSCFCGNVCKKSLIPHMKKEHPEKWESWRLDFVRLREKGWSYKRIMWKYRAIFSWSIIDREIRKVVQEGKAVLSPKKRRNSAQWNPNIPLEKTSIWDFTKRGDWAVHSSDYRGNWAPQIPRNLILKYTTEKDLVFDPFVGGGTSIIEAYLLNRKSIGMDINAQSIQFSKDKIREMNIYSQKNGHSLSSECQPIIIQGDAHDSILELENFDIYEGDVDLICGHPPYLNSIIYTNQKQDLSTLKDVKEFCEKLGKISEKLFQLLKNDGICGILIGDVRQGSNIIPLGFDVMNEFLDRGFTLMDTIIKIQHNDTSTEFYKNKELPFCLLKHEYLFLFKK